MMTENLTPKERYDLNKRLKKEKRLDQNGNSFPVTKKRRWFWLAVIVLILALGVIGLIRLIKSASPVGSDFSRAVAIQNQEHLPIGAAHPAYNSNPPTSGWHYENPAPTGFQPTPPADEYLIHNLEHGDIWISYRPEISEEIKSRLKGFAGAYVVVTPRAANDEDIALAAWGRLDTFSAEEFTPERVGDFIKRHDNRGPEKTRSQGPRF